MIDCTPGPFLRSLRRIAWNVPIGASSAYDVDCAKCGAVPGDPCRTILPEFSVPDGAYRGQGKVAAHVHQARINTWGGFDYDRTSR